jgi:uncharacterized protein
MENIAVITGASKGIGKAFADIFAKNGYSLVLIARHQDELETLQKELRQKYACDVKVLAVDLAQPSFADTIMAALQADLANIEVLVNNAGYGLAKKFDEMPEQDVDGIVNVLALSKLAYKILPFMVKKKRGKILNVASTAAYLPGPYMAVYYASKAYVLSFSQAIYEEYKGDGITISVLCPGVTKTFFQARAGMQGLSVLKLFPSMTAEEVAAIGYHGLMKNKRVIISGILNKLIVMSLFFTPSFISAKITGMLENPKQKAS